jgi:hypothetical protein
MTVKVLVNIFGHFSLHGPPHLYYIPSIFENRWDENGGLRRDAARPQLIDALEAQEIKETVWGIILIAMLPWERQGCPGFA